MSDLSESERDLLAVERSWWQDAGVKDDAIRARLGLSTADYHRTSTRSSTAPRQSSTTPC